MMQKNTNETAKRFTTETVEKQSVCKTDLHKYNGHNAAIPLPDKQNLIDAKLLSLRDSNTEHLVSPEKIIRIDVIEGLITVELSTSEKIFLTGNLKCFEEKLSQLGFVRINRQTLVNLLYVGSIKVRKGNHYLVLQTYELPVTRRRWSHVKQALAARKL
ncbi:MAG: LytTR family DNA-binding domain-containing protein [Bacteroidetes bacterium]|jgi:DNA-binding LytR/AlgR family response regulator|nr:LytTR family DNA-binding domain-containing protein [Bacteroidota bacterium]